MTDRIKATGRAHSGSTQRISLRVGKWIGANDAKVTITTGKPVAHIQLDADEAKRLGEELLFYACEITP